MNRIIHSATFGTIMLIAAAVVSAVNDTVRMV